MTEQLLAGRYRLEAEIGAGGMGRVWRARDVRLDREVAVKTVDLAGVTDPALAGRFQREIVLTARLVSPHTVTVFDGGVDGRTAYLVMELLRGESLAQAIGRGGPLSLRHTLDVARQVTLGLAAAHAVGLVHRDIKPANVMLTEGRVKLLDFGIAQLTGQADPQLTAPQMTIGTAAYMAPEQAAGQRTDAATDRYALGCLIMTMLTGRPPFDGDQAVLVAGQQINAVPPRLSARRPDVPPALDDLVARLLAKLPQQRPGTAEVLAVLDQVQRDPAAPTVPVAVPSAPPPAPTRPYTRPVGLQPAAPSGGGRGAPLRPASPLIPLEQPGSGWIAGVLLSLISAVLLAGLAGSLAGAAVTQLGKAFPTRSASPTAKVTTPAARPTPTATRSRSATADPGRSVALAAALQGVRLALNSLPDSPEKTTLQTLWDTTSQHISAGRSAKDALAGFDKAVKKSELEDWQRQAVLAATAIVKNLL